MIDTTVFQNKTAVYYTLGCDVVTKLRLSEKTMPVGALLTWPQLLMGPLLFPSFRISIRATYTTLSIIPNPYSFSPVTASGKIWKKKNSQDFVEYFLYQTSAVYISGMEKPYRNSSNIWKRCITPIPKDSTAKTYNIPRFPMTR